MIQYKSHNKYDLHPQTPPLSCAVLRKDRLTYTDEDKRYQSLTFRGELDVDETEVMESVRKWEIGFDNDLWFKG